MVHCCSERCRRVMTARCSCSTCPLATRCQADRGGTSRVEVVAGEMSSAELVIPPGIHVRGRVVDASGAAVPAARVWLSEAAHDYCDGGFVTTADQAGQFSLRCVSTRALPQCERGRSSQRCRGSGARRCGRNAGRRTRAARRRCQSDRQGHRRARWTCGRCAGPHRLARVRLPLDAEPVWRTPTADRVAHGCRRQVHRAWTGDRNQAGDLGASRRHLSLDSDRAAGSGPRRRDRKTELETGATLTGRVADDAGRSVAGGVDVDYRSTAWFSMGGEFHDFRGPRWSHSGASTDADGRYRIDCITPGTLRLIARKDDMEVRGELPIVDGESATWDPVLVEIAIRGRARPRAGRAARALTSPRSRRAARVTWPRRRPTSRASSSADSRHGAGRDDLLCR